MPVYYHSTRPKAWIRVSGEDAPRFLQSQFSNELNRPEPNAVTYGLWLDRKGRVVADSYVLKADGGIQRLFSTDSSAESIIEKLEAFIIADDVVLEDETAQLSLTTLWGEDSPAILRNWGFRVPEPGTYIDQGGILLMRGRRSIGATFEILSPEDADDWLLQRIAETPPEQLKKADGAALELERIRSGVPAIPRDCGEEAIPQELGIDSSAVSYTKGCFIGQEVMARVKQTGRHTRKLVPVTFDGNPGALPAPVMADDGPVGAVTSAQETDDGRWVGLAIIRRKALDAGAELKLEAGAKVELGE